LISRMVWTQEALHSTTRMPQALVDAALVSPLKKNKKLSSGISKNR